ncbi:60S ribosomal protein L6, partial [Perkinsus olseni]
ADKRSGKKTEEEFFALEKESQLSAQFIADQKEMDKSLMTVIAKDKMMPRYLRGINVNIIMNNPLVVHNHYGYPSEAAAAAASTRVLTVDDKFILIIIIMMIPSTTTTPVGQGIEVRCVDGDDDGYYSAPELGGYNHHINEQTQQLSSSSSLRDHSFNNTASLPLLRGRFLSAAASSLSSTTSHRGEGILHGLHQHHHNDDDDGDMTLLYGVLKDDNTHGGGRDGPKSSPTSITSNQQQNIIIKDGITSTTTTKKEGDDGEGAAVASDMIRTGSNNNEDSSLYERSIRYKKVFKLHRRLRDNNSNTFYTTLCNARPNHHHHHPRHNVHNADNKAATTITSSTSSGMRGITKYSSVVQGCDAKQQQEDDHHAYKSPLTIPIQQHNTLTGTTAGLSSSTLPTDIDNIIITSNVILPPRHPTPLAPHDDEVTPAVGNSEVPTVATTTSTTNQQQQQHQQHHQHQHGGSSLLVLSSSPSAAAAVATIPSAINNEWYSPKASSTTTGRRKGRPVGDNDEVYNTKPSTLPPKIINKNKDSTKVGDIDNGDDRSKKKHAAAAAASILSILKTEIFGLNPPCKDDVNTGRRPAFKQVLPDGRRLADLAVMPGRMEYSLTYGNNNNNNILIISHQQPSQYHWYFVNDRLMSGFMLCLDATLEELTYMPISCIVGVLGWIFLHRTPSPTQKSDMARIAILAVTTTIFMK